MTRYANGYTDVRSGESYGRSAVPNPRPREPAARQVRGTRKSSTARVEARRAAGGSLT